MNITQRESEYLKILYRKQVEGKERVTTTVLSRSLNVSPATVTESFQKLANKNLVRYIPYRGVKLTSTGLVEARKYMKRHRILETLFVKLLKYNSIAACKEAARIDYYCSQKLINSISSAYNHPVQCPCNKRIIRNPFYENTMGTCEGNHSNDSIGGRS